MNKVDGAVLPVGRYDPFEMPEHTPLVVVVDAEAVRRWSGGVVRSVIIDERARRSWPVELVFGLDRDGRVASVCWREPEKGEAPFAAMSVVPTALLYLLRDAFRVVGWSDWEPWRTSIPDRQRASYGVAPWKKSQRVLKDHIRVTADRKALLSSESSQIRSRALRLIGRQEWSR